MIGTCDGIVELSVVSAFFTNVEKRKRSGGDYKKVFEFITF